MEYIRVGSKPLGVKVTTYDINSISKAGVFFTVNPKTFELLIDPKNDITRNQAMENNILDLILEKIGYDVLRTIVNYENGTPIMYYGDRVCNFGMIENYLSPLKIEHIDKLIDSQLENILKLMIH